MKDSKLHRPCVIMEHRKSIGLTECTNQIANTKMLTANAGQRCKFHRAGSNRSAAQAMEMAMKTNANSLNLVNIGPHDDSKVGPTSQFMNSHELHGASNISERINQGPAASAQAKPSQYPSLGLKKTTIEAARKITGLSFAGTSSKPSW